MYFLIFFVNGMQMNHFDAGFSKGTSPVQDVHFVPGDIPGLGDFGDSFATTSAMKVFLYPYIIGCALHRLSFRRLVFFEAC